MARRQQAWKTSVRLLLDAHAGDPDPERVICEKARDLVARAAALGWSGPPFDVSVLAELLDIKVEYEPATVVEDAMLVPNPETGQFAIKVSTAMPLARQRFSIGHEITHTFFPDCAETIRLRGGRAHAGDAEVEALCDTGASEMLFPLQHFRRDAALLCGPSLAALAELRQQYQAS